MTTTYLKIKYVFLGERRYRKVINLHDILNHAQALLFLLIVDVANTRTDNRYP